MISGKLSKLVVCKLRNLVWITVLTHSLTMAHILKYSTFRCKKTMDYLDKDICVHLRCCLQQEL